MSEILKDNRVLYRINGWNDHFETAKSRNIGHKSWGVYPLKHGSGYCRMMSKKNGASVYGVFIAMCSIVHQKPKETREGYLTDTGGVSGYPYDEIDISAMTRITRNVIRVAIEELIKIRWITPCDSTDNNVEGYHRDITGIPQEPYTERTERTEKRREEKKREEYSVDFERWFLGKEQENYNGYPSSQSKMKAFEYWNKKKLDSRVDEIIKNTMRQIEEREMMKRHDSEEFVPCWPNASTYINQERWDDVLISHVARAKTQKKKDKKSEIYVHVVDTNAMKIFKSKTALGRYANKNGYNIVELAGSLRLEKREDESC